MNLTEDVCRTRATGERLAHLATVSATGHPHLVPITFVASNSHVAFGIDEKPKSTSDLKRLRNIQANPRVAVLWDRYDEDWSQLWWVRADGNAKVEDHGAQWEETWSALEEKYEQYQGLRRAGPVVLIEVRRWRGWGHG